MVKLQRRVVLSGEDSQEDMRREDSSSNGIGGHVSSSYFRENEMDQLLTPKPEVDLDLQTSWQRKGNTYAVVLLCIVGAVLAADQNLMAPNLTQVK